MTSVRGRCCPQKLEGTWTAKAHEIHTQEGQGWGESQADFLTGRGRREGRLLLGDNIALRLPRRKRAGGWGWGRVFIPALCPPAQNVFLFTLLCRIKSNCKLAGGSAILLGCWVSGAIAGFRNGGCGDRQDPWVGWPQGAPAAEQPRRETMGLGISRRQGQARHLHTPHSKAGSWRGHLGLCPVWDRMHLPFTPSPRRSRVHLEGQLPEHSTKSGW